MAEEEQLYLMLMDIVENDKDKLEKLMCVIRELEDYCCKETEYWNKKYFQLGFTCMIDTKTPIISKPFEKETFSMRVHNFLDTLRTKKLDEKQKLLLSTFINNLKKVLKVKKEDF